MYPFFVLVWVPGNDNPDSLFERGYWSEIARCQRESQAEEVALCVTCRYPQGVQIAERREHGRLVPVKFLPEVAKSL